jgi:dihydrofolate reductase
MRRIIVDSLISLDGYFAGPKDEIDWFVFDDESRKWSIDILKRIDTVLYGRVTYEGMAAYWGASTDHDPFITRRLNELPKIVFSRTLKKAGWRNSTAVREDPAEYLRRLKGQSGGDMAVLGSGSLVSALLRADLIDEFRIRVQPIILGAGRALFTEQERWHHLKLIRAKGFKSGVVALHYEPADPVGAAA